MIHSGLSRSPTGRDQLDQNLSPTCWIVNPCLNRKISSQDNVAVSGCFYQKIMGG